VRTKQVLRWGMIALMVCGGVLAWMVYTTEHLSKHEYRWQRDYENKKLSQEIPFGRKP